MQAVRSQCVSHYEGKLKGDWYVEGPHRTVAALTDDAGSHVVIQAPGLYRMSKDLGSHEAAQEVAIRVAQGSEEWVDWPSQEESAADLAALLLEAELGGRPIRVIIPEDSP